MRILLHMPNWLGDVVMTTPLLDLLSRALTRNDGGPAGQLHLAVRSAWAPLFRDDPRVTDLIAVDRTGRHAGVTGIWRQGAQWRRGRYDAVVLGPPSLRAGLVASLSGAPLRVGHATDGRGFLLRPAVPRGPRGLRHYAWEMVDLGLALLAARDLPVPAPDPGGAQEPGETQESGEAPSTSLPGCVDWSAAPLPDARPLWAVAPGTTYGEAKTWPLARLRELVALAVTEAGVRVVLLGDTGAAAFAQELAADPRWQGSREMGPGADVVDLTGQTDLEAVVRILKASTAFVGNDSGLMHVAGALGIPTVGVFGSSNPAWTRPLGPWTAAVAAEGFACRPCYRRTCNQPRFCLDTISGQEVLQAVANLVRTRALALAGEAGEAVD